MTIYTHRSYLEKHRFAPRQIQGRLPGELAMVVVIPVLNEPLLLDTLESLEACLMPSVEVACVLVFNSSERSSSTLRQTQHRTLEAVNNWIAQAPRQLHYFPLHFPQLPHKHAGVGLARKIGMDEGVDMLARVGKDDGLLLCLDADTRVAPNYLQAVYQFFQTHPSYQAASLDFEHPLQGETYAPAVYQAITWYELYLRYHLAALRMAGHPYAYHTIGSAMAVRSRAYQRQGGMNRRKAGEDFYFLQKFMPGGQLGELHTTTVFPSPRPSDRVPFGTGKAIQAYLDQSDEGYPAFSLQSYREMQAMLTQMPDWYSSDPGGLAPSVDQFFAQQDVAGKLAELRQHVASKQTFVQRFFRWFDGLKALQFLHFARDHMYPDEAVENLALTLIQEEGPPALLPAKAEAGTLLLAYRQWQKMPFQPRT